MANLQTSGFKLTHEEVNKAVLDALNGKIDTLSKRSLLDAVNKKTIR